MNGALLLGAGDALQFEGEKKKGIRCSLEIVIPLHWDISLLHPNPIFLPGWLLVDQLTEAIFFLSMGTCSYMVGTL